MAQRKQLHPKKKTAVKGPAGGKTPRASVGSKKTTGQFWETPCWNPLSSPFFQHTPLSFVSYKIDSFIKARIQLISEEL